jgi:hypothetical protein
MVIFVRAARTTCSRVRVRDFFCIWDLSGRSGRIAGSTLGMAFGLEDSQHGYCCVQGRCKGRYLGGGTCCNAHALTVRFAPFIGERSTARPYIFRVSIRINEPKCFVLCPYIPTSM